MHTIELAPRVTPDVAQALWYALEAEFDQSGRAGAVACDASSVIHLSAPALQVLLVAQARAARNGGPFLLVHPSEEAIAALKNMGAFTTLEGNFT